MLLPWVQSHSVLLVLFERQVVPWNVFFNGKTSYPTASNYMCLAISTTPREVEVLDVRLVSHQHMFRDEDMLIGLDLLRICDSEKDFFE